MNIKFSFWSMLMVVLVGVSSLQTTTLWGTGETGTDIEEPKLKTTPQTSTTTATPPTNDPKMMQSFLQMMQQYFLANQNLANQGNKKDNTGTEKAETWDQFVLYRYLPGADKFKGWDLAKVALGVAVFNFGLSYFNGAFHAMGPWGALSLKETGKWLWSFVQASYTPEEFNRDITKAATFLNKPGADAAAAGSQEIAQEFYRTIKTASPNWRWSGDVDISERITTYDALIPDTVRIKKEYVAFYTCLKQYLHKTRPTEQKNRESLAKENNKNDYGVCGDKLPNEIKNRLTPWEREDIQNSLKKIVQRKLDADNAQDKAYEEELKRREERKAAEPEKQKK